jgi:hypothetical protein
MPRPNPPRKRPRRRPDSMERSVRAEVSLAKQTAQVKEKNGASDSKSQSQSNGKAQSNAKGRPAPKGGAAGRPRRIDEPFVPWARRSYAILVAALLVAELLIGAVYFLTISGSKPPPPPLGLFLLAVSYQPLVPVAAALVAAPVAKFISKESRSLRFMESVIAGIFQYFVWLALFVALTYLIGGLSTSSKSATVAAPSAVVGLIVIDILSYVATFLLYPALYKLMRRRPPPRRAPAKKPGPEETKGSTKSIVDKMDEASARDPKA